MSPAGLWPLARLHNAYCDSIGPRHTLTTPFEPLIRSREFEARVISANAIRKCPIVWAMKEPLVEARHSVSGTPFGRRAAKYPWKDLL